MDKTFNKKGGSSSKDPVSLFSVDTQNNSGKRSSSSVDGSPSIDHKKDEEKAPNAEFNTQTNKSEEKEYEDQICPVCLEDVTYNIYLTMECGHHIICSECCEWYYETNKYEEIRYQRPASTGMEIIKTQIENTKIKCPMCRSEECIRKFKRKTDYVGFIKRTYKTISFILDELREKFKKAKYDNKLNEKKRERLRKKYGKSVIDEINYLKYIMERLHGDKECGLYEINETIEDYIEVVDEKDIDEIIDIVKDVYTIPNDDDE